MIELQPNSQLFYETKYQLKDQFGKNIDKNIEKTFQRVALALSKIEKTKENKEKYYHDFLWALNNGAIPAGRILSNAGAEKFKPKTSLINCVVSGQIFDSIDDILEKLKEAGMVLRAGCGIGLNFSTLRPKNAIVTGAGAKTSGPMSFCRIFDQMCGVIESAGDRRGAMMLVFNCNHPDILEAIQIKRQAGQLRHFNISIAISDEFIKAVKQDKDWDLIFPAGKYDFKENAKIKYADWAINDDKNYTLDKNGKVACKIYKTIKARKIWDAIMKSTYEYSDPGFLLIDNINKYNNLWFCEHINTTNPCLTKDSWIFTTKGSKQVKDLINKQFITNINGQEYKSVNGFFSTGTKKVYQLETKKGYTIKCTDQHPFFKIFKTKKIIKNKLKNLSVNDYIILNNKKDISWKNSKLSSDGDGKLRALIFIENSTICNRRYIRKNEISNIEKASYQCYVSFFSTIIDSKACYIKNNKPTIVFNISDFELAKTLQRMLFNLNIISSITRNKQNLIKLAITKLAHIEKIYKITNLQNKNKIKQFNSIFKNELNIEDDDIFSDKIISINYIGKEEVFNTTIEKIHQYESNGFLVGNCGEQPLPEYNSCLLGSINLTKLVENPFSDNATFNFDKYKKIIHIFTRMLDNVIEINNLPLEKQRKELKRKRRHGMGFFGLGSCLSMLKLEYGSAKALKFCEHVSKILALESYRTGALLAKEKGEAPILKEKFVVNQKIINQIPKLYTLGQKTTGRNLFLQSNYFFKWLQDKEGYEVYELLKKYGCRFTHATSIAPTGTISASIGNNVSNGIEPTYEHFYSRNVIIQGRKTKQKIDIYSHEYLEYIKYIFKLKDLKSVFQKLQENPDIKIPAYLKTKNDLDINDHLNVVNVVQKWIDSSISKTINVESNISFDDFKDVYFRGHSLNLKGITTYRYNPDNTSGVLVEQQHLKKTRYKIILENNEELIFSGDQKINYDNEITTVNNLYDAFKHQTYGTY